MPSPLTTITAFELNRFPILKSRNGTNTTKLARAAWWLSLKINCHFDKNCSGSLLKKTCKQYAQAPATAKLMRANFERLIDGASNAAYNAKNHIWDMKEIDFALLISCVWRKLVLKQRIEEEIEGVGALIWQAPKIWGFYSYGEIGPAEQSILDCKLHNQTMTITLFNES